MTAWLNSYNRGVVALIFLSVAAVFSAAGGVIGYYFFSKQSLGEVAGLFVFVAIFFAWEGKVSLTKSQNQKIL